ncbi:MAG: LURP-one-related family protein [Oscillospiraceae bacterium]|nr:LURP-one-related family protein [Oscillospiraceae bacterium]
MIFYIKQKILTFGDKFSIYDEAGNEVYYVEGEIFTKMLHIYDSNRLELAFIRQRLFTLPLKFEILQDGNVVAAISRKFSILRQNYKVEGLGWSVSGDFTGHCYDINTGDSCVARISKAWFTLGDAYQIDIQSGVDEILVLAMVLAIDAEVDASSN